MTPLSAAQVSLAWLQGHLAEAMASGNGAEVTRLLSDRAVVKRSNADMRRMVTAGRSLPPWIHMNATTLARYGWRIPDAKVLKEEIS